ncbi:M56 family metallopeptidase [Amycolatopsis rhizosphaerae]|uniref:M56 family metallopeptidase n=1 Tax=Amycolatopsis rhizosphaerae TaxID=2053003 RepID=A0A558DIL8_9PSEU|nr:M56 family metallopeptidase [Amycolatopsis rhizosphaerae]TVT60862.1 M56 family metallopeptidase [Amycolatopsis rhizosphaerae]
MNLEVVAPFLSPLAAWPVARFLTPKLPPHWASWLLTASCAIFAVASTIALLATALAGFVLIPTVAALIDLSPSDLRGADPVSVPESVLCAGALLVALAAVARAVLRYRRRSRRLHDELDGHSREGGLIVVPDAEPLAFAVPGRGGRIVVSRGMLAGLAPAERSALLAHENAHLRLRHHVFLAVVTVSSVLNPLVRPLGEQVRFSLERWADEKAARRVGDRRIVATAVAKAALATRAHTPFALAATGGPVPRRVAALLDGTTRPILGPLVLLGMVSVLGIAGWAAGTAYDAASELHAGIETAHVNHGGPHGEHCGRQHRRCGQV